MEVEVPAYMLIDLELRTMDSPISKPPQSVMIPVRPNKGGE